jgi:hypothetical protein
MKGPLDWALFGLNLVFGMLNTYDAFFGESSWPALNGFAGGLGLTSACWFWLNRTTSALYQEIIESLMGRKWPS